MSSFQLGQVPLLYCTLHKPALRQGAVMVAGLTALGACMPWYLSGVISLVIMCCPRKVAGRQAIDTISHHDHTLIWGTLCCVQYRSGT